MSDKVMKMNKASDMLRNPALLRKRAEQQLALSPINDGGKGGDQRQLHELQVHQLELKMQNEALLLADIKANAALENYAELYDSAPLPYMTIERNGMICNANPAAALLLERQRSALDTLRFGIFVSGSALPLFNAFIDKAFASTGTESHETQLLIDANVLSVMLYTRLNQQGNNLLLEIVDITQQKQSASSFIDNELNPNFERIQLQTFINTTPDLVWLKDINGVFLSCNSRVESLVGVKAKDVIGKTDSDLFSQALAEFFSMDDKNAIQPSGPLVTEQQITFADGHTELIETTKAPMFDEDGNITGVLGIGRNLTEQKQVEERLRKSEERYALAMEGTQNGIWDWNVLTSEAHFSPRWKSMLGYAESEIKNDFSEWERLIHPDDKSTALLRVEEFFNNKATGYESEFRMQHKSGQYINILSRAFAVEDEAGKITRMVGTHVDTTERKKAEDKLKLAANVFTHAREGIMITDASAFIVEVNETLTEMTGYSRQELIGKNPLMFDSRLQSTEFHADIQQQLNATGFWSGELKSRRKSGEFFVELKSISVVKNESGIITHHVSMSSDITLVKEHQSQLERIANYDLLTDLPNRVLLAERLSQATSHCNRYRQSFAVAFLDLDGFKAVNDRYGHDIGDELLISISARMKKALCDGDTLARFGGDEFVAVLTGLGSAADCEPVLERLLVAASAPITIGGVVLNVSASIGVTLYPQDSVNTDQLMRHADQAMYIAKESGKNRYHMFDTVHDDEVKTQRKSLADIGLAVERNEFVLYYQPKVNMSTGDVVGVEALIRWQHPTRGLVPPLDFLPIIEGHALSLAVGKWVIDTALGQIIQWQSMGLMLPISVNISAHQLQQSDFVTCLEALLANHSDVSPDQLELEVLESTALTDVKHVSATMHACRELGVQFALDDFGTGYSSLTHLRRLPASLIKIDQSFVRDMLVDPDDLAIIVGVISLAKAFKRNVIAEGVETIQHGTELLQLGCELAQGYGIAKPMSAADIPEWMSNWKVHDAWLEVGVK